VIHLIAKDLYVNRKYIFFVLLYLFFILYGKGTSAPAVVFGMSVVSYGILTRSCFNDDKDRGDIFLRTLPIKASTIVLGKYALGLIILLFAIALFAILAIIGGHSLYRYYPSISASVFIVAFVYAIYLPVFFKKGYIKAKTFQTIFFICVMAVSFGIRSLIDAVESAMPISQGERLLQPFINTVMFFSENYTILLLAVIMISTMMIAVSICCSLKFYVCSNPKK